MAENYFAQFDDDEEDQPLVEPANSSENYFAQFDDEPADVNYFSQYGEKYTPSEPEPTPAWEEGDDPTGEDYFRQVMAGGAGIAQGVGWLLEKAGGALGKSYGSPLKWAGKGTQDVSRKAADRWMKEKLEAFGLDQEGLSPLAKQAMEAELTTEKGSTSDKWNKVKLMTAGSMLGTMAGMGLGSVFTKGLQGAGMVSATGGASKAASTIGFGAGEAAVAAPAAGAATEDEVRAMTHEELLDSLEYQALLDGIDLPENEAREKAKDILALAAGNKAGALAFVSTFVLSAPFGNKLNQVLDGTVGAARGRIGAALQGGATESTQEFLQSGSEQLSQNIALQEAKPSVSLTDDLLESAVAGAASGGLMGGTLGAATGPRAVEDLDEDSALKEVEDAQRRAEDAALAGGADNLEAAMAGAAAAGESGTRVQQLLQKAEKERLTDEETNELSATPAAGRTPVRVIPKENLIRSFDFDRAEQADQEARDATQAEAARSYEQQQRAAQAAPAEAQRAAQKESEEGKARNQRQLQIAEEAEAEPGNPMMAKALEKAEVKAAKKARKIAATEVAREKAAEAKELIAARVEEEAATAKEASTKLLPDLTPDVVVDKKGNAVDRAQMKIERDKLDVDAAAGEVPLKPSEIELERRVGNLKIALETPDGMTRTGKDDDGAEWSTTMKGVDYGFVRGSNGADSDQIDAFVSTKDDASYDSVFVIDQVDQAGAFDEHKVMIGFPNKAAAVKAYKQQYDKGWKVGPITQMSHKKFEKWVKGGRRTEPVGQIASIPVVAEDDIAAIQERAQRKGRKKPTVRYRLPEGVTIEMTEDELPGGTGGEISLELKDQSGEVVGGITADVDTARKQIRIGISKVDEQLQGKGAGLEMYNTLLQEAFKRGYTLTSDVSVSAAAARVYEALERRGAKVTRNPNAYKNDRGGWVSDDIRNPVFVVEPIDIKLRKEDLEIIDQSRSKRSGDPLEQIIETIEFVMERMPGLKGKIVLDPLELPAATYEQMRDDGQLGAKGMFVVETGEVFIFAANHDSAADAIRTLLHEGVAHKGLRVLMGDKLPALLRDVWQNGDQNAIERVAKKYGFDTNDAVERMEATEEYIAELAETPQIPQVLRRIMDAVRQFLRSIGVLNEWTDSDIQALLRDAKRELQGKPLNKINLTEEVTIEETGEVVEISDRADVALRRHEKRIGVFKAIKGCLAA